MLPAVCLMMAAFMSSNPGRVNTMKLAAVPPIMCNTEPRSVTSMAVMTVDVTKVRVSSADSQLGTVLMFPTASNRSCSHAARDATVVRTSRHWAINDLLMRLQANKHSAPRAHGVVQCLRSDPVCAYAYKATRSICDQARMSQTALAWAQ